MENHLFFGLRNDLLHHIDDVQNGLNCNCICPECKCKLVANNQGTQQRKGIRVKYFSHYRPTNRCDLTNESLLHKYAKQILSNSDYITIPNLNNLICAQSIKVDKIYSEDDSNNILGSYNDNTLIKADLIAKVGGKELIVEIKVTHAVDKVKVEKIKQIGISAIEIDLSFFGTFPSKNQILNSLHDSNNINWIYNIKYSGSTSERESEYYERFIQKNKEKGYDVLELFTVNRLVNSGKDAYINHRVVDCPLKSYEYSNIKKTKDYEIPLIKDLVASDYWNGLIYGKKEKWVYLDDNREVHLTPVVESFKKILYTKHITNRNTYKKYENGWFWNFKIEKWYKIINNKVYLACEFEEIFDAETKEFIGNKIKDFPIETLQAVEKLSKLKKNINVSISNCLDCKFNKGLLEREFVFCSYKRDFKSK